MAKYYYIDSEKQKAGPLSVEELVGIGVTKQTPVWTQGMANWTPAGEVADFADAFNRTPPPFTGENANQGFENGSNTGAGFGNGRGCNSNCGGCGANRREDPNRPKPNSWLVPAIICTVLCGSVFGIVGLVFAILCDNHWSSGRYEAAVSDAKKAKLFTIIGFVAPAVILLIYAIVIAICAIAGSAGSMWHPYAY